MHLRKICIQAIVFTAVFMTANFSWAIGFQLSETKEQLKLKYDVEAVDHGTGRVSVTLTIADQGKLKPLYAVQLVIPSEDGPGHVDLSISLDVSKVDGKRVSRVHMKRELAERAELQLRTWTLDGKMDPLTWYYHPIPLAEYLKTGEQKKD